MVISTIGVNRVLCAVLLIVCSPLTAAAFGARAHEVVGHIAEQRICATTRSALLALDRPIDGRLDIAGAGLWADRLRAHGYWDSLKPWHYINIPDGVAVADAKRPRNGDVLTAIEEFSTVLRNPAADPLERAIAYRLLVHFIADVHQPLHVGRRDDRGGNRVKVRVNGKLTNLHSFWDRGALDRVVGDTGEYATYLLARYQSAAVATGGDALQWAGESMAYRRQVYDFAPARAGAVPVLDREYQENALQIINLRLYQAGIRVAAALDAVFCNASADATP